MWDHEWLDIGNLFGEFIDQDKVEGEKKKEKTNTNTKQKNESNTSWRSNADNYSPCWEGLFVEVRGVVETAVGITTSSDDDTPVKKLFQVVWVLYFLFPRYSSLAQFMCACQNWYQ